MRCAKTPDGRVAEWFKAAVLKTAKGASPSWVRIPPLPPISPTLLCLNYVFSLRPFLAPQKDLSQTKTGWQRPLGFPIKLRDGHVIETMAQAAGPMTQRLKHQLGASISSPAQDFETLPQDARSSFTTAAVCCEPQGSPNDLWLSPAPQ